MQLFTATAYTRKGRKLGMTGEHTTRLGALDEAFTKWPNAWRVSHGYGYLGGFNIVSTNKDTWTRGEV